MAGKYEPSHEIVDVKYDRETDTISGHVRRTKIRATPGWHDYLYVQAREQRSKGPRWWPIPGKAGPFSIPGRNTRTFYPFTISLASANPQTRKVRLHLQGAGTTKSVDVEVKVSPKAARKHSKWLGRR